ncbi:MAG: hypothetical protein M1812_000432 [Candelaria pacifica]|nr:MAG: hypothetical protein M1812_000432 [Candelaria pacifica]
MSPRKGTVSGSPMSSSAYSGRTRSSSASKVDAHYLQTNSGSLGDGKQNERHAQNTKQSTDSGQSSASSDGSCTLQDSSSKDDEESGEGDGDSSAEADGTDDEEPESFALSHAIPKNQHSRQRTSAARDSRHTGAESKKAARCDQPGQQHGMGRTSRSITKASAASGMKRSLSKVTRSSDDQDQGSEVEKPGRYVDGRRQRKRAKSIRKEVNAQGIDEWNRDAPTDLRGVANQLVEADPVSSEDDEYEGVDLISDSDPDDPNVDTNVERLEERNIIDEDEGEAFLAGLSRSTTGSEWDDLLLTDGLFLEDVPFFAQQIHRGEEILGEEVEMFRTAFNRPSSDASSSRRVRWEDEVRSASTSTVPSDEESAFPDLFVEQERYLDVIGNELSDGEMSYWDLEETNEAWFVDPAIDHGEQDSQSEQETSNDDETDEGETTDEDESLTALKKCAQNEMHRRSTSSSALEVDHSSHESTTPFSSRRKGPSMVSWAADPTKPYAITDSTGRRVVIYPPRNSRKAFDTVNGQSSSSDNSGVDTSPCTSFASVADDDRSEISNEEYNSSLHHGIPILYTSTFSGELGNEYPRRSSMEGPSHALYRLGLQSHGQAITQISNDDGEGNINLRDFIDFGEDSSDSEEGGNQDEVLESPITATNPALQSSLSPNNSVSSRPDTSQSMLSHFDLRGVAAFRRNQIRHSTILSRPQQSTMAHNAPFSSRGAIKGGRFAAAQTPLSPLRKRRPSNSSSFSRTMLCPTYKCTTKHAHHSRSKSAL